MISSEIKISISGESYDEETAENYRNFYAAEKHIISNLKRYQLQIFTAQIEDLNVDCVKISRPHLLHFPRNKLSKTVVVGPVHRFLQV